MQLSARKQMKAWLMALAALPACWTWTMPFFGGPSDPDQIKGKVKDDLKALNSHIDEWKAAEDKHKKELEEKAREKGTEIANHTEEIKKGMDDVKGNIEKAKTSELETSEVTGTLKKYGKNMEDVLENPSRAIRKRNPSQSEEEGQNPFASILSPDYPTNDEEDEEDEKDGEKEEKKGFLAGMKEKLRKKKEKRAERKRRLKEEKQKKNGAGGEGKKGFLRRFLSKKSKDDEE